MNSQPLSPPRIEARNLAQQVHIRHGFFGRVGGVSRGIYASLNAGPGSKDDPDAVSQNRQAIARALGVSGPDRLLTAFQIHSAKARIVEGPWSGARPEVDALATRTPGIALAVLTADCAPVLLSDAQARVIGSAHAGWRGAIGGVVEAAVAAMIELGARAERISAAIGPCIGWDAYEVGPEFVDRFAAEGADSAGFFQPGPGDRSRFDLKGYVGARLRGAGVTAVETSPDCTFSDEARYFSHRRSVHRGEPDYGRNLSAIVLDAED